MTPDVAVVTPLNNPGGPEGDTVTVAEKLLNTEYPDPPPVILVPESIAAQAAYQLRYKNTEYYSWVSSSPKCFQVLGLSPSLLQNPML